MYSTTTIDERAFRCVEDCHEVSLVQDRPMSPRYRSIDPKAVADKLERGGFQVQIDPAIVHGRRGLRPIPWRHVLRVTENGPGTKLWEGSEMYNREAAILLSHDGSHSIAIRGEAVRLVCENQFLGGEILRIRHDSEEAGDFEYDPAHYIQCALEGASRTRGNLQDLQFVGSYREGEAFIQERSPRLFAAVAKQNASYSYGMDFWALAQVLTATKRVGLIEAAAALVNAPEAKEGRLPAAWNWMFPVPAVNQ
jgi:hypothetical protein